MIFIIGGSCQGKLDYGLSIVKQEIEPEYIADGRNFDWKNEISLRVLHHFHFLVRRLMEEGEDAGTLVDRIIEQNPDIMLITDEIGNGIVPLDPFERQWREATGRLCCRLAKEANEVHRVFCGIGMRLK